MEEFRIDCLYQTEEELVVTKELRQNIFRLNHTMPDTEEYRELLHKVFPHLGENCRIETPFSGVRTANVKFGRNVIVMPGCLMMSAGGITIGENAVVGAGSVVTHDVEPDTLVADNPAKFIRKIKSGLDETENDYMCIHFYSIGSYRYYRSEPSGFRSYSSWRTTGTDRTFSELQGGAIRKSGTYSVYDHR